MYIHGMIKGIFYPYFYIVFVVVQLIANKNEAFDKVKNCKAKV